MRRTDQPQQAHLREPLDHDEQGGEKDQGVPPARQGLVSFVLGKERGRGKCDVQRTRLNEAPFQRRGDRPGEI